MKTEKKQEVSFLRVAIKAILIFLLFNILFIFLKDIPYGNISLYNLVFPGRERLPFGETPGESFNLTVSNLDAMINSHKLSAYNKFENDYRIIILGDSSVWGFLQKPENTLAGMLEKQINFKCNGKDIEVFNLGYPSLSILKDLALLDKIKMYDPDLVIWLVTLESFVRNEQLETPLIKNNPIILNKIIDLYGLDFSKTPLKLIDYTIIWQKRNLADIIRLQFYGVLWAGSGIDQIYTEEYTPAMRDLEDDDSYKTFNGQNIKSSDLALDVVLNGISGNPEMDFILINEPILMSKGQNSDIRYNFYYPRWAYDEYRAIIETVFKKNEINYFDFWNLVPESEFTNSAIHLTDAGEKLLADETFSLIKNACK